MTLRMLVLWLVVLLALPSVAQASDTRGLLLTQRFTPGTAPPHRPLSTRMLALRGETEGFQLAFRGTGQRLTPRVSAGSAGLLRTNTRILRVAFVDVARPSTAVGRRGRHADPLPPVVAGGIPTARGRWSGIVVLVDVPRTAAARRYHGQVELVDARGAVVYRRSFSVRVSRVSAYAAGDQRAFRAIMGIQPTWYRQQALLPDPNANGGTASLTQMINLHRFLARMHMVPNNYPFALPAADGRYHDGNGWFRWKSTNLDAYMRVATRMQLLPHFTGGYTIWNQRRSAADAGRFVAAARAHWQQRGHLLRGLTYLWAWDEPGPRLQRERLPAQARALRAGAPGAKLLVTTRPTQQNRHLWNGGGDDLDAWAIPQQRYYGTWRSPTGHKRMTQRARRAGKEIWSYYYFMPRRGLPQLVIDAPGTDARMMMLWNGYEGHRGWLVWHGARWVDGRRGGTAPRNPYRDTHSFTTPGGAIANGDTSLFYPPYAPQHGLHDKTAEPVSSLRMESLRDGVEDADLVDLHRRRFGAAATNRALRGVFGPVRTLPGTGHTWPAYRTRGLAVRMEQARRSMINRLEGSAGAGTAAGNGAGSGQWVTAWRWTGATWQATWMWAGPDLYALPFAPGWLWAWTHTTGWVAVPANAFR